MVGGARQGRCRETLPLVRPDRQVYEPYEGQQVKKTLKTVVFFVTRGIFDSDGWLVLVRGSDCSRFMGKPLSCYPESPVLHYSRNAARVSVRIHQSFPAPAQENGTDFGVLRSRQTHRCPEIQWQDC